MATMPNARTRGRLLRKEDDDDPNSQNDSRRESLMKGLVDNESVDEESFALNPQGGWGKAIDSRPQEVLEEKLTKYDSLYVNIAYEEAGPECRGNLSPAMPAAASGTVSPQGPYKSSVPERASSELHPRRSGPSEAAGSSGAETWAIRKESTIPPVDSPIIEKRAPPSSPAGASTPVGEKRSIFKSREKEKEKEQAELTLVEDFVLPEERMKTRIASFPGNRRQNLAQHWSTDVRRMIEEGNRLGAVNHPAPSRVLVQCYVTRTKTFMGTHQVFQMHLDTHNTFLLAARRRKKSRSSHFIISQDLEDLKRDSANCLSKVKANFVGTDYILTTRAETIGSSTPFVREETGIHFKPTALSLKGGPRMLYCTCPIPNSGWNPTALDGSDSLSACLDMARSNQLPPQVEECLAFLANKPPEYDETLKAYSLDFHGRVKEASVKNFQLVRWDHKTDTRGKDLVLQFGKVNDDTFALDFAYPLSVHTAFAIALASIDTKLCFAV